MREKILIAVIVLCCLLSGCSVKLSGPSFGSSNTKTMNGQTEGHEEKSSKDRGSAKYTISRNHVEMTNFSFDADEDGKMWALLNDDDLIYAAVCVYDDHNDDNEDNDEIWQTVIDGHYKETFQEDTIKDQINALYHVFTGSDDTLWCESLREDNHTLSVLEHTSPSSRIIFITEKGTDRYIVVEWENKDHKTEDILRAAYAAFGDEFPFDVDGDGYPKTDESDSYSETEEPASDKSEAIQKPEITAEPEKPKQTIQSTGYSLSVGGTVIDNIRLPEKDIQSAKSDIIQLLTDDYVNVVYSDSYIDNDGNKTSFDKELESIASTWNTQPKMQSFEKDGVTGYAIIWNTDDYNCIRVYQPITGAKTYLCIDITDHSKLYYDRELIDKYWLDFGNQEEQKKDKELVPYDRDKNSRLNLTVGGVLFDSLPIPEYWLTDVSDILIQTEPETNIVVNYADSYVDINDTEAIMETKRTIEDVNSVSADLNSFVYNGKTGYILSWNSEDWKCVRLFQPIGTASTYLKVDITDYNKTNDIWSLANQYALDIK